MNDIPIEKRDEVENLWQLVLEKKSAAKVLIEVELYNDSLSRAYYSAYHAVTLLFFLLDRSFSSHKQLIGMFNKEFVHGGSFSSTIARYLSSLFESRQTGDYDYHIRYDKDEALEGLNKLDEILLSIQKYIQEKWDITLPPIIRA